MPTEHEFDGLVRSWLQAGDPDPMPRSAASIVDDVVALLDGIPQRRAVRTGRPRSRDRSAVLAVAAAAVMVLVVAVGSLVPSVEGPGATGPGATVSPSPSRSPRFTPRSTVVLDGLDDLDGLGPGTRPMSVDGIRFSFDLPAGWETFGDGEAIDYISKSDRGSQGAEAQMVFAAFPSRGDHHWECHYLETYRDRTSIDPSLAELADVVASVPGTDLISGPTQVTVGGLEALEVVFTVRDDVGCDPGFFYVYQSVMGGALWPETEPGDTVRVWIVATPERFLFIEAKTKPDAGDRLEAQIQAIVDAIIFE